MPMQHSITMLADADAAFLLSPFKPILIAATLAPWAWLISTKLDKDAMYFHLNRIRWNALHMAAAAIAVLCMIFIPIFWVGWPVGLIVLLAPILAYWKVRNAKVPESKRFYLTTQGLAEKMEMRRKDAASRGALIRFIDAEGNRRNVPQKDDPLFSTHLLAEDIIGPSVEARATKVEIAATPKGFLPVQTIDGVKYRRDLIALDAGNQAIDYLKDIAGLDVQDRRRRQIGTCRMEGPSGQKELTITTAGSSAGQDMRIEFDRADQLDKPIDGLGYLPQQLEAVKKFDQAEHRHGVVLLGTPPSNGLTTLGYAMIDMHDAYTTNVKTLEREVKMRREGVDHQEFDADNPDVDYATSLQSMLRRDPDVVLGGDPLSDVGDETATVVASYGVDGPLVYVEQRQPGVKEQVVEWVKRVGDIKKAVKPLNAVVHGRLMRSLCPHCRQPYRPSPEQLKKLNLPAEKVQQLYKANGKVEVKNKIENCPVCHGTGYLGQVGVYEVMVLDDTARKHLMNNDLQGAYTHCRREGMIFLQEAALRKVLEGMTTLEEFARVIAAAKSAPKPPSQPQPATA